MARSGMRSWVRKQAACEPDGCGAQPGQPCVAYVPKHGKTTGNPTADVHAARWRAFRAQQRRRITERAEEKDMTEISDEEAREALWASSEAGRAAVTAACAKADDLGLPRTSGRPAGVVEVADIAAIVYAAHRAHEEVSDLEAREEREERADEGHVHRWRAKGVQEHRPLTLLGPPAVNTAVLARCDACRELTVFLLPGTWTWQDVAG